MTTHNEIPSATLEPKGSSERKFGLVFAVFFLLVSLRRFKTAHSIGKLPLGLALGFFLLSWLRPAALARLNTAWTRLGHLLARVTTPVIMGFLYYGLLTPLAWVLRATGKLTMPLSKEPAKESYWVLRNSMRQTGLEQLKHQF